MINTGYRPKKTKNNYDPNLGFIGKTQVNVSNYIFTKKMRAPYRHTEALAKRILDKEVSELYRESKRLTKFLKSRDLTFSKQDKKGMYKTFTVPCTSTVVPLQKSLFNEVEKSAQRLIVALRLVLQDIYGNESLEESKFVQSLPEHTKNIFIKAIKSSSHYYPQLHHPNMKDYPFFDNVGLDLVLVEDYLNQVENGEATLENLPFQILELNAGSPSGASNNMNMLEGIHRENPEILDSLGKFMPNDHFKVLADTYKTIGKAWTGVEKGVQVLLPPGGQNAASPEIHQLAAYSGLVYADPVQLYEDSEGFIRLRTISGTNPIVTAIYSRINSDSALFDPKEGIILRDADSGEPFYLRDALKLGQNGKAPLIKDANGKPIPLQSDYAIPNALKAIKNRKLYLGGLNRVLDNKIILTTLTDFAPKFFSKEIEAKGLTNDCAPLDPPVTLPPEMKSVEMIKADPDRWVVKSPNLAGGAGVFILKTLTPSKKKEIIEMIEQDPEGYAYQELVKIARIPVAVQRKDGHRFANLAADMRIWVFYGGEKDSLPKMTHNALVRYAPQEKGAMSSIVNTSKGGGYAPFVVVDDIGSTESVSASELVIPVQPVPLTCEIPTFVSAQMVQVNKIVSEIRNLVYEDDINGYHILGLALSLKAQCKEILSFLHPRSIESVYKIIDTLNAKLKKAEVALFFTIYNKNKLSIVEGLTSIESKLPKAFFDLFEDLHVLNHDLMFQYYTADQKKKDLKKITEIRALLRSRRSIPEDIKIIARKNLKLAKEIIETPFPYIKVTKRSAKQIENLLENFCEISRKRLLESQKGSDYAKLFDSNFVSKELKFETLYLGEEKRMRDSLVATQKEFSTNVLLTESNHIEPQIAQARKAWLKVLTKAKKLSGKKSQAYVDSKRKDHFKKFPFLTRYQDLINSSESTVESIIEMLPILPYAKYNLEQFAANKGVSIEEIFSNKLEKDKICLLSDKSIKRNKLSFQEYAGECFAKKKVKHGLFSNSDIFVWVRKEANPFSLIYTAGHELIHYQQINEEMKLERRAISTSSMNQSLFLNYYGNFLGISSRNLEDLTTGFHINRKPLYGFADILIPYFNSPLVKDIRESLNSSVQDWHAKLSKYGSNLGYTLPNSPQIRVKALQEILPALENAKNIIFAKEVGLDVPYDEVQSALPTANKAQLKRYKSLIYKAAKSTTVDFETLRVIGNHQYHGVYFPKTSSNGQTLKMMPSLGPVYLGNSYNQTQQQQQ